MVISYLYRSPSLNYAFLTFQFLNWKQRTVSRETCRQFPTGFLHTDALLFPVIFASARTDINCRMKRHNAAHLASAWQKLLFIAIFFVGIYPNLAPFLSGELNCTCTALFWHAYDFEFTVKFTTILNEIYKNNLHGSRRKRRRAKIMRSTYKKTMTKNKNCAK